METSDRKTEPGEGSQALPWVIEALGRGLVIPAHPLALDEAGRFDRRSMTALTRYYHAAGAGGLAVAVHTTQFEIRRPEHAMLDRVLEQVAETARECDRQSRRSTVLIAGVCGRTDQAIREAKLARQMGYHAALVSLAEFSDASEDELIEHCDHLSQVLPLFGFYLQSAVGGRSLSASFWTRFCDLPNVVAIKIAPFDRYQTLDVIRGVAQSRRCDAVALYTGNDDNLVADLLTRYRIPVAGKTVDLRIVGGLLGHWACWTRRAVELLNRCHRAIDTGDEMQDLLTVGAEVTDCNAALFDAANGFSGCIAGIHAVLYRQGLIDCPRLLNPDEGLSPGQQEAIDRISRIYPHLQDDDFIKGSLADWRP